MRVPWEMQLPLARQAVKETLSPENHLRCNCREEIDAGKWDNGHKVKACLRAMHLAAQAIEEQRADTDNQTNRRRAG